MKIVFLVHRSMYYRFFFPIIEKALSLGYEVECWHDYGVARNNSKNYSFPDVSCAPKIAGKLEIKTFLDYSDLKLKLIEREKDILALISLHPPQLYWGEKEKNSFSFKWITLMHGPDSLAEISNFKSPLSADELNFCAFSPYWLKWGTDFLEKYFPQSMSYVKSPGFKPMFVGMPEFDSFKDIDKDKIREKYGIPMGKNIVLYLPFPFWLRAGTFAWEKAFSGLLHNTDVSANGEYLHDNKLPLNLKLKHDLSYLFSISKDVFALKQLLSGRNEAKVFRSIKKFCRNNDLLLFVKPRLKFPVAEAIKNEADLVVWDEEKQNDPTILKELLSITKLTVSYFSLSVLSSVFAGVYHLNIVLPDRFFASKPAKYFFQEKSPSMFNFSGVCDSWSIEAVVKNMETENIDRFIVDPVQRKKYVEQFIGFDDSSSSQRVLSLVERG